MSRVAEHEAAPRNVGERRRYVAELFDASATHYDKICRVTSFGSGQSYRREALERAGLEPGMRVLDVATGTGLLAREAAGVVGHSGLVVGVDPSAGMAREARQIGQRVVRGLGEALPVMSGGFDFLCMGYGLRHVESLEAAFADCLRVLAPGGRLVILEITQPTSALGGWLTRQYFQRVVPLITHWLTRSSNSERLMRYYWDTIVGFVPPAAVAHALSESGFIDVERRVVRGIFSEYVGRKDPGLHSPHH